MSVLEGDLVNCSCRTCRPDLGALSTVVGPFEILCLTGPASIVLPYILPRPVRTGQKATSCSHAQLFFEFWESNSGLLASTFKFPKGVMKAKRDLPFKGPFVVRMGWVT